MKLKKTGLILLIAALITTGFIFFSPVAKSSETSWTVFWEVLDIIHREFVDKNVQTTTLVYGAIKGMLESLNDPYSRFMEPKAFSETKVHMKGEFYGVGIQIGMKNNQLTVISPIEGTPADKAGIKALDTIVSIDGVSTDKISLEEAVTKIRGTKGSKVSLGVKRKGEKELISISIMRDAIKLKSVTKTKMLTDNIGYIQLVTFESKEATNEMLDAFEKLGEKKYKGVILDLRNNGGGLLDNAIKIASIFLKDGIIVQTVDRNDDKEYFMVKPDMPLKVSAYVIVLINEGSASASEILAGAIQDHKRGLIVGRHSFGKASVQNVRPLSDGSAVLVTIAKYLTPNGNDISKKGIQPDVEVDFTTENIKVMSTPDYEYKEKDDVQLQKALELMKGIINTETKTKTVKK